MKSKSKKFKLNTNSSPGGGFTYYILRDKIPGMVDSNGAVRTVSNIPNLIQIRRIHPQSTSHLPTLPGGTNLISVSSS